MYHAPWSRTPISNCLITHKRNQTYPYHYESAWISPIYGTPVTSNFCLQGRNLAARKQVSNNMKTHERIVIDEGIVPTRELFPYLTQTRNSHGPVTISSFYLNKYSPALFIIVPKETLAITWSRRKQEDLLPSVCHDKRNSCFVWIHLLWTL